MRKIDSITFFLFKSVGTDFLLRMPEQNYNLPYHILQYWVSFTSNLDLKTKLLELFS